MYVSYDYYRVFYYVARYGSISQAARMLLSNQPNLTRALKNLESELGCPLFFRTNRGMKLTPEGEKLYAHVSVALEHLEAGESEIAESKNLQSGTVSVAASEVSLRCLLLPILKKYRMMYPGVRVRISNYSTPQAIAALKEGTEDIAVVTTPTVKSVSLVEKELKPFREVAICSPVFKDLLRAKISLSELQKYPLVALGSQTKTFEFYSAFFGSCGLPYDPDIEAATTDQIMPMVEADLGVGFVPEEFVTPQSDVRVIDLAEEIPTRSICLVKRKEQSLSVAARELEKMIAGE